jgi:hypothetical protein
MFILNAEWFRCQKGKTNFHEVCIFDQESVHKSTRSSIDSYSSLSDEDSRAFFQCSELWLSKFVFIIKKCPLRKNHNTLLERTFDCTYLISFLSPNTWTALISSEVPYAGRRPDVPAYLIQEKIEDSGESIGWRRATTAAMVGRRVRGRPIWHWTWVAEVTKSSQWLKKLGRLARWNKKSITAFPSDTRESQ